MLYWSEQNSKWYEIACICHQAQGQHIQWTINSLWWLCLDLQLTPSQIYDVIWNPIILYYCKTTVYHYQLKSQINFPPTNQMSPFPRCRFHDAGNLVAFLKFWHKSMKHFSNERGSNRGFGQRIQHCRVVLEDIETFGRYWDFIQILCFNCRSFVDQTQTS
jgi:hypothetical protein